MASDIEEDDLEALRCAVLASMKNSVAVKPIINEDEELAALREAALKTANIVNAPVEPTAVLPPSNPAIKFIGDSKPTDSSSSPSHPLTNKSGRNLIVIATKEETTIPAPPSTAVKLLRPQDKFCSDNNSTSSTPTRPKVSNKFDRFESSESDSDSSSSSDSEDEAPIYAIKPEEELLKSDEDLNKLDKVAPDDDVIKISVETSKEGDTSTDQSFNASLVQAPGELSSIALEDIPIPEVVTNNVTEKPVRDLCDPTLSDYVSSSSEDETERAKTGSQNSTSDMKRDFNISVSVDKVDNKNRPTDAGRKLTVESKHPVEEPAEKPRSIFQRLGNKSEIVPRTTDVKKDMPIQKSSLLYDIISKKSPGLLMKCKSGSEVEYRSSRLEEEDTKGDKAESGQLTERERIILQARKKKFEANKPVEVEKKTLSLKGILRKRSAKKARRNREEGFNQKRDKDIGLSDSEAENRKSDTKRIDKRETDGARKRKSDGAKNDAKIDAKDDARNDAILINKRDRYNTKEKHIDSTKVSRHNTNDDDKYKKSSDSKSASKNATINTSERVVKKGKSSGGKGDGSKPGVPSDSWKGDGSKPGVPSDSGKGDGSKPGVPSDSGKGDGSKPGVPSDSESSDGGDVSWRFHHTGTSSKDTSEPQKKLFERPQEDIEKDKRKRHVELPKDRLESLDDRTFDQKERRTNMHPFRLAGIRLDGNRYEPDRVNNRPDSRAGGYRRNRSHDRFHARNDTRRFGSFDRFDGRNRDNHRFVRDDTPDNHRRKNFVEEDDDESSKNVTRITSVIKPSKKPCDIPKPGVSSSVSDSSPERRGLGARRSRRTVHVPKSHDEADNAEVQAMTVSLKRKQRKVSSEEQVSGIADTERTMADVSGTKEKPSKSSVHKRLGKSQKVDAEKQPKESRHKKHKKKKEKREVTNDSDTEAQLDAKIRKIQENNAAIIKRRREVIEDRDRYG